MKKHKKQYSLYLLIGMLFFASCTPTRKLTEGQYMLVKNKVVADKKEIPISDIIYVVRPMTNKKSFNLFFWRAGIYQSMLPKDSTKDNKTKQWIRKNFGEPLVLLDTTLLEYSQSQISMYMKNKGYFDAKVDYEIKIKKTNKKKAKAIYNIKSGTPCKINSIKYRIKDPHIEQIIFKDTLQCLVKNGNHFDVDVFAAERSRITTELNNTGYYNFTENYIVFRVDTNLSNYTVNVVIDVLNPEYTVNEQRIEGKHRKYYIQNIDIISNFISSEIQVDTITYTEIVRKTDTNTYRILYTEKIDFNPKTLVYPLSFSPNDLYKAFEIKRTYNRYSDMRNFNFIKISFKETEESKANPASDTGYVNSTIQLSKMERNSLHYDLLGKNIGKDFGIGINMSYSNRNTFKSGEIFSITGMYANEFQRQTDENSEQIWRFRNFEVGGDIGMEFSRFLFPVNQQNISKRIRSKTIINIGGNYRKQDHYTRFILSTGFRYEWNTSSRISHVLTPLSISLIKIYPDSVFNKEIQHLSKRIRDKYTDHLLIGSNYQLIYTNHRGKQRQNFYLLRFNADAYGNTLYLIFNALKINKNDNEQYAFWGIPFASYVSGNIDYAYNIMIGKKSSLVLHADFGVGVPTTKNSLTLPFEKSFYLGGSNSMRAWRLRTLGPGSYMGATSNLESTGDIKIEWNIEYRTPIYRFLHLALFTDAGNIWNFKKNIDLPGGEFQWDKFYKEIAIGSGAGLRLDFSFFVIRLDAALQIYNPAKEKSMQWINKKVSFKDIVFSVGIGYPF
ncbi:MAG: BamA/TamA family outer membrane protein [Bacteroidales bacterium]|nr:BamA/TamA family outer membrane protein [Bacteroidales bacterium]